MTSQDSRTAPPEALLAGHPSGAPAAEGGVGKRAKADWFDWATLKAGEAAIEFIPESLARDVVAFPARASGARLTVVMAKPGDYAAIRRLEARSRMAVAPVAGRPEDILSAIDTHYSSTMPEKLVEAIDKRFAKVTAEGPGTNAVRNIPLVLDADDLEADGESGESGPVIRAVDSLIAQAAKARATDIHIEPLEDWVRVRFRIDGFLQEAARLPRAAHGALLSRVKVMAGMDIAERRRPQDGHFGVRVGESTLDIRAATTDTVYGEMIVLRILNKSLKLFSLDDLGLLEGSVDKTRKLLRAPYGILLVAGPTGAGKTTTLYSALQELPRSQLNVVTIEDPVEYRFEGINAIQINEKAGLTFARLLRAVLRLDPDVILVGEIRDSETASIAVQAALTGHLVLSSVHANDAVRAVTRVIDLGVEPFLLASALLGVVAQRMVRKIDPHCPVAYTPGDEELEALGIPQGRSGARFYKGEGCYFCSFTGYHGRTGLFEIAVATDEFKSLVMKSAGHNDLWTQAIDDGMVSMREDGAHKALAGITTPLEVMRSVYTL